MELADFQIQAIGDLVESMEDSHKEVIFKSPTGSGKTIVLTHFMDTYGKGYFGNVFVWLTPGKGNLEEQSKHKMDKYIHNSQTKLLSEVMAEGFKENDCCFINWEKLVKKGNTALKESEYTNFQEHIINAKQEGLKFIVIVDESHQNNTVKADDIISLFTPKKIIRTSATPSPSKNVTLIEVQEEDVIAEGLIKKMLAINEGFGQSLQVDNQVSYLIEKALDKHVELKKAYVKRSSNVNPLILIQLPNKSAVLQEQVESYLAEKNITYENGLLAVWLSNQKQNLEEIEELNARPIVAIIKQAIATGWDCPRAQILVKLRENSTETFEIQTIGRIRRMPEIKHYDSDLLDSCYLYTFDKDFTEGVKSALGKKALHAKKLFLKKQYRSVELVSEERSSIPITKDATQALQIMNRFYEEKYKATANTKENRTRLNVHGYIFEDNIIKQTSTGQVHTLVSEEFNNLERVQVIEPLNTHQHGREYHNRVSALGVKLSLPYEQMNTIFRRLFLKNVKHSKKIVDLETRELYAFIINNFYQLKEDFLEAMSSKTLQTELPTQPILEKEFHIPLEYLFTYDAENRVQREYESNVFEGYLSSAETRSDSEKSFEKYCEESQNVEWIYKNGDKGKEYFSIVYYDNFEKQKTFYPDYIISSNGEIWVIETKGGFNRSGQSEDIDKFSAKKFEVMKNYLQKHDLKGGFVRKDKSNNELFICIDNFNNDIKSKEWILLSSIL